MLRNTIQIAARCARALNRVSRPIEGIANGMPGPLRGLGATHPVKLRNRPGSAFRGVTRVAQQATALSLVLLACSFVAGVGAFVLTQNGGAIIASVSAVDVDDIGRRERVQVVWRAEAAEAVEALAPSAKTTSQRTFDIPDASFAALLADTVPPLEGDARVAAASASATGSSVGQQPRELEVVAPTAAPPPPAAELAGGPQVAATVSFYYCQHEPGVSPGDGGGFCGAMRDGTVVRSGAAACDVAYLGQQFRIVGDPTGRVYQCNDTGSAVNGMHRDIWFNTSTEGWAWLEQVGRNVTLQVLP